MTERVIIEEMVEITRDEYDMLLERDRWLSALEAAGVDNWNGWDEARSILREWDEEDDEADACSAE